MDTRRFGDRRTPPNTTLRAAARFARRRPTALAVALVALMTLSTAAVWSAGASHGSSSDPRIVSVTASHTSVDLVTASGTEVTVVTKAHDPDFGGRILLVEHSFRRLSEPNIAVYARYQARNTTTGIETWSGTLTVDDARLFSGTWSLETRVYDRNGGSTRASGATLEVTADVAGRPLVLALRGVAANADGTYPRQALTDSDTLQFDASVVNATKLLRDVSYRTLDGAQPGPWTALTAPNYEINGNTLPGGVYDVEVRARDRALRTETIIVPVARATSAPVVRLDALTNATFGEPFNVTLNVTHPVDVALVASWGAATQTTNATSQRFFWNTTWLADRVGANKLTVQAVGVTGFTSTLNVTVDVAPTPVDTMVALRLLDPRPLAGQSVAFEVTARQKNGSQTLPLSVALDFNGDWASTHTVTVAGGAAASFPLNVTLPAGWFTGRAQISPPPAGNETDPSDQEAVTRFEVYAGRVDHGAKSYFIRDHPTGYQAVDLDGQRWFTLTAAPGPAARHDFVVNGEALWWNATDGTTVVPVRPPPPPPPPPTPPSNTTNETDNRTVTPTAPATRESRSVSVALAVAAAVLVAGTTRRRRRG